MAINRYPASWLAVAATAGALLVPASTAFALPVEPDASTPGAIVLSGDGVNFTGTSASEIIIGTAGNDVINGGGGNDVIVGGGGNDTLLGGSGNNTVFGDAGDDVLTASTGNDIFTGGAGTDRLTYSDRPGDVTVFVELRNRNDVSAPGGEPQFDGTDPDGTSFTTLNGESLTGEDDKVYEDIEDARGGAGPDILVGTPGPNTLTGLDGQDSISGLAGDDSIRGAAGGDSINAGDGNDAIEGGTEADSIRAGAGDDTIYAGATSDGNDDVQGQDGVDTVLYVNRTTPIRVTLANTAFDDGEYDPSNLATQVERDRIRSVENASTGSGNDILTGDGNANALAGGAGVDLITGGLGSDSLSGGPGDDVLNAQDGVEDRLKGGTGTDSGTKDAGIDILSFDTEF